MNDREFIAMARETAHGSKLASEQAYTQHGDTSCLTHSVAVAYYSCRLAERLGGAKRFEMRLLARGALLHDYFLYDWHEKSVIPPPPEGLHGFSHPLTAHRNAKRDFDLTALEENIIANHMFPLTLLHMPTRRESWIVTLVDKYCSTVEVFARGCWRSPAITEAVSAILAEAE